MNAPTGKSSEGFYNNAFCGNEVVYMNEAGSEVSLEEVSMSSR